MWRHWWSPATRQGLVRLGILQMAVSEMGYTPLARWGSPGWHGPVASGRTEGSL